MQIKMHTDKIILTAHSLGAAVSQLMSLELYYQNITNIVYSFGQPRVGNKKYADFVNKKIPKFSRYTHNRDLVPHIPIKELLDYHHSCGEIFENSRGELTICSKTNCEDEKCSQQYKIMETNAEDHLTYLGHKIACNTSVIM
jgi:hypothetical protein